MSRLPRTSGIATCRGCGATIRWVHLKGKPHPVDPSPRLGDWHTDLVVSYRKDYGDAESETTGVFLRAPSTVEGYVSHFDTCPKADRFRKRPEPQAKGPRKKPKRRQKGDPNQQQLL